MPDLAHALMTAPMPHSRREAALYSERASARRAATLEPTDARRRAVPMRARDSEREVAAAPFERVKQQERGDARDLGARARGERAQRTALEYERAERGLADAVAARDVELLEPREERAERAERRVGQRRAAQPQRAQARRARRAAERSDVRVPPWWCQPRLTLRPPPPSRPLDCPCRPCPPPRRS